jgi:shikimate kinase
VTIHREEEPARYDSSPAKSKVPQHTRIFLTGFMGSGKSTLGPLVATLLDYRFVDLDEVIEAEAGQTISEIFSERGEPAFRELETAALESIRQPGLVLALGGGAFLSPANRRTVRSMGISVWLDPDLDVLAGRLATGAESRPLLQGPGGTLSGASLRDRLRTIRRSRISAYGEADIHFRAGGASTAEHDAEEILRLVREHMA